MLLGMFCAFACLLPAGQALVTSSNGPVTVNGSPVATYVDDTVTNQASVVAAHVASNSGLVVYGTWWTDPLLVPGALPLAEYYPVYDATSNVLPVPAERGYILQAFSWSDNPSDQQYCQVASGVCSAPTYTQMFQMWCGAISWNPQVVFWYVATPENLSELLQIEATPCPRVISGRLHAPGGGTGHENPSFRRALRAHRRWHHRHRSRHHGRRR